MATPHYPDGSYLLRRGADRRFRVLDAAGLPDPSACAHVAKLLPVAHGLTVEERAHGSAVVARLLKAAANQAVLDDRFGFPIAVEVLPGGTRSGIAPDGTAWSQPMIGASYGFLPGTVEIDSEPVDCFLGSDLTAPLCFAVTQLRQDGTLDERKLLLGYASAQEAIQTFLANGPAWRMGEVHAFPVGLLRGLLGYEASAPGAVAKGLDALSASTGPSFAALSPDGLCIAGVERVTDARCRKGVTSVGTFSGEGAGGLKLPAQGGARPRRVRAPGDQGQFTTPVEDEVSKAGEQRVTCAIESCATYKGTPILLADRPDLAQHPALTAPLTWTYDDPEAIGGWLGAVEADDESWICFVAVDGKALLWTARDVTGAVVGDPVIFARPDLAANSPLMAAVESVWQRTVRALPIAKGLDATAPMQKRIVYGVVLEPEPFNGAGDGHQETYSAAEIEQAAHNYCASFLSLNDAHGRFLTREQAAVVETFIAPCDLTIEGSVVRAGSWVLAARIIDDGLWARVLSGELRAWSIEGYSERICTACNTRMSLQQDPIRGERWVCPSVVLGKHR